MSYLNILIKKCLTLLPALLFSLSMSAGYSSDHKYFDWGDGRGIAVLNADNGNIHLHYKNGRFFCDEACTVECIALGYDNNPWAGAISWFPLVDVDLATMANPDFRGQIVEGTGRTNFHSPRDITQLSIALHEALSNRPNSTRTGTYRLNKNDLSYNLNIYLHETMTITPNVFHTTYAQDQDVYIVNLDQDASNPAYFQGHININRYEFSGVMVDVNVGSGNHVNFKAGRLTSFNNNTTSNDDVVVKVHDGCLFMFEDGVITNTKSGSTRETYYGIGVLLAGTHDHQDEREQNPSIELGRDPERGGGSCVISKCRTGINVQKGVLRLKSSPKAQTGLPPYTVKDNFVAVNMAYNSYMAKWCDDISMINSKDVVITLEEPEKWKAGDWIFLSGMQRTGGLKNTPLLEDDLSALEFTNADDMTQVFGITFDQSVPNSVDYRYPLFKLSKGVIYNTRTKTWYTTLYGAVTNPKVKDPSVTPIQDGDVLVYYGNVNEQRSVTINYNLTIRSAKSGTADANVLAEGETIDSNGYTSTWYRTDGIQSFITVAQGKSLNLGGSDSGPYSINANNKGRAVYLLQGSNVSAKENMTVKHAASDNGGAFYVSAGSILNISGATIRNNQASSNGGGIMNYGTLNVTSGSLSSNTATAKGRAIWQGGTMNLSGSPSFDANDIYLCKSHVITKVGTIDMTSPAYVSLEDEVNGRDILTSKVSASGSSSGKVLDTDLSKLNVLLSNDYTFNVIYNATGNNAGTNPKDVIELEQKLKDLIILKSGMKFGEVAVFKITSSENPALSYTVPVIITNSGSGSATIKDLPVAFYKVQEETDWSWAYKTAKTEIQQNIGVNNQFSFVNTKRSDLDPKHAESSVNNVFE